MELDTIPLYGLVIRYDIDKVPRFQGITGFRVTRTTIISHVRKTLVPIVTCNYYYHYIIVVNFPAISWHPVHEGLFVSGGFDGAIMFWMVG